MVAADGDFVGFIFSSVIQSRSAAALSTSQTSDPDTVESTRRERADYGRLANTFRAAVAGLACPAPQDKHFAA